VLKSRVFGGRKNPPRGLQLMNLPQPLHPGRVDQVAFGHFARFARLRRAKRNVPVNRVLNEVDAEDLFFTEHGVKFGMMSLELGLSCVALQRALQDDYAVTFYHYPVSHRICQETDFAVLRNGRIVLTTRRPYAKMTIHS